MDAITFWLPLLFIVGSVAAAVRYLWFWKTRDVGLHPEKRLLILGHRGAPSQAPENTLPGFQAAFAAGLDGIELDVMETADGELVVAHDYDLEWHTNGTGFIHETMADVLLQVNAAHRWEPDFPSTPIPRLDDVLKILPEHVIVNIELKTQNWFHPGFERKVLALVHQYDLEKRTVISSFNPFSLLKVRWLASEVAVGYIWRRDTQVPWYLRRPYLLNLVQPHFFHPQVYLVTRKFVEKAHRHGMKVNVWTVNNRPVIDYLKSLGIDGIFTDFPELITSVKED
ncbi:glycerophosphodiester phosphodiesterase [Candidatus Neomarinimicrobiota bacterium]